MSRTLIASLAVGALLTMSTGAFAQTMMQGKTVSDADLPRVQAYCNELSAKAMQADNTSSSPPDGQTKSTQEGGGTSDPASQSSDSAGTDAALVTSVDLNTLTLDDCKTGGLIK